MLLLGLQFFIMLPLPMFFMSIPLAALARPSDSYSPLPPFPLLDSEFYLKPLTDLDLSGQEPSVLAEPCKDHLLHPDDHQSAANHHEAGPVSEQPVKKYVSIFIL